MELVVGASTATMDSLLGKLSNLLAQQYALTRGVRGDIQYISDELASMKAFLLDIAQHDQDNRKKDWMKQIRDLAYDCEDCIDDFAHRLPKDSNFNSKGYLVTLIYDLWTWRPRSEIASNIAELKVRAQLIAERRIRYGVKNPETSKGINGQLPDAPVAYDIAEDQLARRELTLKEPVGVKRAMEELEEWVKKPMEGRAVLSIVGFGGVGKTTIAMALYNKVMKDFECRAWVTVSQNYDQGTVLRDILRQINPDDKQHDGSGISDKVNSSAVCIRSKLMQAMQLRLRGHMTEGNATRSPNTAESSTGYNKLETTLRAHLQEKKSYIILVDDIWSADTWRSISKSLPENTKAKSIVIVTSRLRAVGAHCCQNAQDHLYSVDFLSDEDAKMLFNQSFCESKSCSDYNPIERSVSEPKSLESIDDQLIVREDLWKRCGGQPLAVVTLAGLVACNRNKPESYWNALRKLLPERATSSVTGEAREQVNSLTLDGVKRILDCCYNDLPGDLKTCLLYLCMFPKGWKISRKLVTRRWIAEGFVSKKLGLNEEEVAETYFNQLLRRKLIRPVDHSSNGKLKTFQVHDMVLDYIASKASEENFITVVGGHWMMPVSSGKVRRLSMQSNTSSKSGDSTRGMNLSQVRSLTVFGSLTQLPFQDFNNRIIQVLDFTGLKGFKNKHMKQVCKMLVLKYLSLRGTEITEIPSMIGKLEYLETLDIRDTGVEELPKEVEQLKLISSILGGSKNKNPRKGLRLPQEQSKRKQKRILQDNKDKEGMKALRILSGIEIDEATAVAGLHQLTGLKKLTIYKLNIQEKGKVEDQDSNKEIFEELRSSIEYLCSCGLQTLAINDEGSHFINSLDKMTAAPRYLVALELSGKLDNPPNWITKLQTLNKLTLSVTVLRTDTFNLLRALPLFSLTFSWNAEKPDEDITSKLKENASQSDGEIFVPEGFKSLKLLRFFAPRVPKLGFCDNAMPALEMIEMRFQAFEGLFGIDTLNNLKGVHLREAKSGEKDKEAADINDLLVRDLKESIEVLKQLIIDHTYTS